jgi:hypothetical protein
MQPTINPGGQRTPIAAGADGEMGATSEEPPGGAHDVPGCRADSAGTEPAGGFWIATRQRLWHV